MDCPPGHHHHPRRRRRRSSLTAALPMQAHIPRTLQQQQHPELQEHHQHVPDYSTTPTHPRFSYLLSSVLGSPFLTTSPSDIPSYLDHIHDNANHPARPPSPTPTADYSIIDPDEVRIPGSFPTYHDPLAAGFAHPHPRWSTPRGRSYQYNQDTTGFTQHDALLLNPPNPFKSLLPRLWDALSTPGRTVFSPGTANTSSYTFSPSPDHSPTISDFESLSPLGFYHGDGEGSNHTQNYDINTNTRNSSPFLAPTPPPKHSRKGKRKGKSPSFHYPPDLDYTQLSPLDGDEGELVIIDDEACFVLPDRAPPPITAVTGLDILAHLPTELALSVLRCVASPTLPTSRPRNAFGSLGLLIDEEEEDDPDPGYFKQREDHAKVALRTLLACLAVSKTWRRLATDNEVWKALFLGRWEAGVDLRRVRERSEYIKLPEPLDLFVAGQENEEEEVERTSCKGRGRKKAGMSLNRHRWNFKMMNKTQRLQQQHQARNNNNNPDPPAPAVTTVSSFSPLTPDPTAPLSFDWKKLYMAKWELEKRWRGTSYLRTLPPATAPPPTPVAVAPTTLTISGPSISTSALIPDTSSWVGIQLDEAEEQISQDESTLLWNSTTTTTTGRNSANLFSRSMSNFHRRSRSLSPARLLFTGGQRTAHPIPVGAGPSLGDGDGDDDGLLTPEPEVRTLYRESKWEPEVMELSGHRDSVYCVEFDSKRIITGSRDRSIMVWSLKTGRLLGSFHGAHRGSVLCLKFERDWDAEGADGFMVSGSSDCTIRVWKLESGAVLEEQQQVGEATPGEPRRDGESDRAVNADPIAVLKGHTGGVLDLRINKRWIVSCSKDTVIRVWDRKTLTPHRILRGHDGPVNAIGLQGGKVVSASGDGKMILWDIESGERLRTFDGHDRGLACIEFKGDLIISGSNDCKIRLWRASTGECVRTIAGHSALVRALSFDPHTGRLVSASYDKLIKIWDLHSGELIREFKRVHTSHIFDVKFDVGRIVSTSHDQKICILDFTTGLDASVFI